MARKKKGHANPAKTSDQPPASDRNPTTTSASPSVATSGTVTTSLLPSSALPTAPPTTATTTQPVLSAPIPPTSLPLAIATNQPPPRAPPLSIQGTHQEHISGTSVGTTTTADFAGPSTAPSASAASTSTPRELRLFTKEFNVRFLPKFNSIVSTTKELRAMVPYVTGSQLRPMDPALRPLLAVTEREMKEISDIAADMQELKSALEELKGVLEEEMKRDIESCGSKREGGGPDSGSGGGDGQGGGVCV